MCLISIAYEIHRNYRLIVAANRDEFYDRPTSPAAFWDDAPEILAGRDLKNNGTWMGITKTGRFAALTNYRNPAEMKSGAPSRGMLVSNYLKGTDSARSYLSSIQQQKALYNGFNLIVGDLDGLYYYSNKNGEIIKLIPGLHGISNHLLNTAWPKLEKIKASMRFILVAKRINPYNLLNALEDRVRPADEELPDTGVGIDLERMLSPIFIASPNYGTRSSTVILIERTGNTLFTERTFRPDNGNASSHETRSFSFTLQNAHPAGISF